MSDIMERQRVDNPGTVLHWYDFLCPFCYIGQQRNAILVQHGLDVVELPFQAHPDIPAGGISVGPRKGPSYEMLEREAREAGLTLRWPLPNGADNMRDTLFPSFTKSFSKRTLFWARTLKIQM